MKIKIFFTILFLTFVLVGFSEESVSSAEIYIKQVKSGELVAFQKTGDNGLVSFSKLPKGSYNINVVLPKQKGKYAADRNKNNSTLNVGYHSDKKMYFIQNLQGNFILTFTDLKKINNSNISPMYERGAGENKESGISIGKFDVDGKQGSLTIKIEALTHKKFEKSVEKYRYNSAMTIFRDL